MQKWQQKLAVSSCNAVHNGTNKNGNPFTIYEVEAVGENGQGVDQKLRSFDDLTSFVGQLVEYDIESYESTKHGVSYTLKPPEALRAKSGQGGLAASLDALRARVDAIEARLGQAPAAAGFTPTSQPAPAVGGFGPPAGPAAPAGFGGLPDTDDIPF